MSEPKKPKVPANNKSSKKKAVADNDDSPTVTKDEESPLTTVDSKVEMPSDLIESKDKEGEENKDIDGGKCEVNKECKDHEDETKVDGKTETCGGESEEHVAMETEQQTDHVVQQGT